VHKAGFGQEKKTKNARTDRNPFCKVAGIRISFDKRGILENTGPGIPWHPFCKVAGIRISFDKRGILENTGPGIPWNPIYKVAGIRLFPQIILDKTLSPRLFLKRTMIAGPRKCRTKI